MKQLTIGIDIDDTITNTFDYLMPAVADFYKMDLNYLKENKISYTSLTPKMKEQELEFARTYFDKLIPNTPVKVDAAEYIRKIKKSGHKIIIITARNHLFYEDPYKTSTEYLTKNNIHFDELYCTFDKAGMCKEQQVDIFIDDSINQCDKVKQAGIKTLLFNSQINEHNQEHTRVYTWEDVYNYIANHS